LCDDGVQRKGKQIMQKVLSGASREALGFIGANWTGLLKMSIIPVACQMLLSFFQIRSMSAFYRSMATMVEGGKMSPEFMGTYFRSMGIMMLGSILAMCLMGLLFVQVTRYRKTGVANWILTDKPGIKAGLLTLVYAIGIMLLTMLTYFGAAIAAAILGAIIGAIAGGSGAGAAIFAVVFFFFIIGILLFLYWFAFRFFVGLPGVALGHSPDFFKDMWPLSKGESWGVPLRMLLATLIIYVPMAIIMFIFLSPMIGDIANNPAFRPGNDNAMAMMPIMADVMERMLPVSMIMSLILMPFMWFAMLLLAIAFDRFLAREHQTAK
jgi:hypothetical protein